MNELNSILRERVKDLNLCLREKYDYLFGLSKKELRSFINSHVGEIKKMDKLDTSQLALYESEVEL